VSQRKIDEAEAERQRYEQQRDLLKAKVHNLNSIDMKVLLVRWFVQWVGVVCFERSVGYGGDNDARKSNAPRIWPTFGTQRSTLLERVVRCPSVWRLPSEVERRRSSGRRSEGWSGLIFSLLSLLHGGCMERCMLSPREATLAVAAASE